MYADAEKADSDATLVAGVQINCLAIFERRGRAASYVRQKCKHRDADGVEVELYLVIKNLKLCISSAIDARGVVVC